MCIPDLEGKQNIVFGSPHIVPNITNLPQKMNTSINFQGMGRYYSDSTDSGATMLVRKTTIPFIRNLVVVCTIQNMLFREIINYFSSLDVEARFYSSNY